VKRRKTTRKVVKSAAPEERQLAVFHNPFSRATKQPKIPDGKITESLGFQTQAVGELLATNQNTAPVVGDGTMHILLFGGQNCGMIAINDLQGSYLFNQPSGTVITQPLNRVRVVGFEGSNDVEFGGVNNLGGILGFEDDYAYWRLVSQGLRLSLLNPQEEDDGWFEAVRINEPLATEQWGILARNNSQSTNNGAIVPRTLIEDLSNRDFVNQTSYSTGLLRDLNQHVFKLNGVMDHHDFKQQMEAITLKDEDILFESSGNAGLARGFGVGENDAASAIKQWVDTSYDMVYIKIHGRAAGNPSRLHYNIVSNQEVVFPADGRESRFHTVSGNVANMAEHASARSSMNSAAHVIGM